MTFTSIDPLCRMISSAIEVRNNSTNRGADGFPDDDPGDVVLPGEIDYRLGHGMAGKGDYFSSQLFGKLNGLWQPFHRDYRRVSLDRGFLHTLQTILH